MKIIELLRLIRKHIVLLVVTPLLLALIVIYLTRKPSFTFSSETTLYTGIASGGGVEMDKSLSFFATNTAFDNLINVIKSRQTQTEVAIRLLAQHLLLDKPDPDFLNKASYQRLKQITPPYIRSLVVRKAEAPTEDASKEIRQASEPPPAEQVTENSFHTVKRGETLFRIARSYGLTVDELKAINGLTDQPLEPGQVLKITPYDAETEDGEMIASDTMTLTEILAASDSFSFARQDTANRPVWLPQEISLLAYEMTVRNLIRLMKTNDTNFVYKLLNFTNPHYSIKAISAINVQRIASSDLVKLKFDSDDPGICQQTLAIMIDVCISNYRNIKENRSDAVVRYFEYQVKQSSARLKVAEDKLLKFNKDNNIINYYEQSKAVAVVKEELDVEYNQKKIILSGARAAIASIENKLNVRQKIHLNSSNILEMRNQLSALNMKISNLEILGGPDSLKNQREAKALRSEAELLKQNIQQSVNDLYSYGHNTDGLPLNNLLNDWLSNVILYEETRAGMEVLADRITEFQKQYAIYAPAGANLKRIEREINVSEQAYLELLHGLNLAKLKMQDVELSSNIKAIDPPFFPLSPNPTKRSLLVLVAAFLGFLGVFITILAMEYFDNTLKNPEKASKILKLENAGIFPKIYLNQGTLNFPFVTNRLLEIIVQKIARDPSGRGSSQDARIVVFFSTRSNEGKTTLIGNLAQKMKKQGQRVLVLTFSRESLRRTEVSQTGYSAIQGRSSRSGVVHKKEKYTLLRRIMGYPDIRIDYDSPFLESPENYLDPEEFMEYQADDAFHILKNYQELLRANHFRLGFIPDYILIELPPILYYSYPPLLVESADVPLLVCRANRVWDTADQGSLDIFVKHTRVAPLFALNGVEIPVIETILGDLPKQRGFLQRILRKLIRFQFYERYKP